MKAEQECKNLGIDIGALAVKIAWADEVCNFHTRYRFHKGHPEKILSEMLSEFGITSESTAITGSGGRKTSEKIGALYVDPAVCLIAAAGSSEGIRHIMDIGGGSLSIVDLDSEGRFSGFRSNSLCAAGTGSFLDEQAVRMKLSLEEMAKERDIAEPPRIAARCAVFAKSDLIHRQQEGFTIPEMWSGLCRGMVSTALSTLFRGRRPVGKILLAGGVAKNHEVVRWLKSELSAELILPEKPETFSAVGAAEASKKSPHKADFSKLGEENSDSCEPRRDQLSLDLSKYPSFECKESYLEDETEVRIHAPLQGKVAVGLDIGSTSTKAAILDVNGFVLADLYRRTAGDPILATKKIFASIERAAKESPIEIAGVATTGSGRKMIGSIIGADRIINEITAHVSGAVADDPDVETIFEIGGQDAKFISLKEGVPHDSNMNYVCAAGTGSFVEEQAGKLGFKLTEIGDSVMGTKPPFSTDRCTVFMEQDVHALIRQGYERREVMGSVLCSVVQNYLNRVVGRHPFSKKKICFMGATARNKGLVAAFEKLVGAPISVSPYCHVMGAYGVARIALNEILLKNEKSEFVGLERVQGPVELKRDICELCANKCSITFALVGENATAENAPSWGYLCGREPDEKGVRVNHNFDLFRQRDRIWRKSGETTSLPKNAPVVGIPRTLLMYSYLPMWRRFFGELGIRVVLSRPSSDKTLAIAEEFISSDYCYPVKLAHGHVRDLAANSDVQKIFFPYMVQGEPHDDKFARSVFCPYNISFPSIAKTAGLENPEGKEIISAVVNLQYKTETIVRDLMDGIGKSFNLKKDDVKRAWLLAVEEQKKFVTDLEKIGAAALAKLEKDGSRGVVLLGRSYNVCDLGANLNLPQKIADLGLLAFTVDMLPLSHIRIDPLFKNMYWKYGRKMLQAATLVAKHDKMHAVFMTNFSCGPDSFLQSYVEKIMRGKPMLMLEMDEHSADAGYITRLEAFRDVICRGKSIPATFHSGEVGNPEKPLNPCLQHAGMTAVSENHLASASEKNVRTIWLPPMHPYGAPLLAAAMRSKGMPARALPSETLETFEMAKRYCRGTECVPAPSTIGAFLAMLKKSDAPERECFFMPTAKGPCRFGQYHALHRMILDEAGYKNTPIESWDDGTGDFGLDLDTSKRIYSTILSSDLLYKARCRLRPYAHDRISFDSLMEEQIEFMSEKIERGENIDNALGQVASVLSKVKISRERKPLVGIVGEIYVRVNTFTNGKLIETVEAAGGEAWLSPL